MDYMGLLEGLLRGDTRSLDYSSYSEYLVKPKP